MSPSRLTDLRLWVVAACGLLGATPANAQVPVRPLGAPDAKLSRPLNRVTGLHELRDGRVVLLDANDQTVLLVDFAGDTAVQLGRNGSGPGEYRFLTRLLLLGGDSIGIEDGGNQRILVLTGHGKFSGILGTLGFPVARQTSARGTPPRTSDAQGRWYALGYSQFAPAAAQPSDSAPIERWKAGSPVRDTVAYVPLPPVNQRVLRPGEGSRAFTASPQWTVGPDGRVAIVRVNPYAVDLIDPNGARIKGKPIPFRRIPVSEAHKREWREEQSRPRPVTIMIPSGAVSAGLRARAPTEPVQWPAFLPPFLDDAARFAPDGSLWIRRTTVADGSQVFDIVDRRGIVVEQVSAPPNSRVAGFGQSHVYLVRLDLDNQEFLERYPVVWRGIPYQELESLQ